ncbi:sodium/proton-translocating pyrophosphatase [Kamptonema cortianum]|nr:sodium/proton-translocating pyrophosphatase [Geitlerinema splendidum]MDK3156315.1 sodium/proton-translocating pyrophosphatase [Kamptonema cortianum]
MSKLLTSLTTFLLLLVAPVAAFASSEANVKLKFSQQDYVYLGVSLAIGLISIFVAFGIRGAIMKQSAGTDQMKEVGAAIKDGALAYLKTQMRTMSFFVLALAIGLFFMYQGTFGTTLAIYTALCFVLGVAASYIAGYTGMDAAVNANMRVAHAATSSYKKALEVAFRSGAVAGLVTVGMGLLGATVIFLVAGEHATKLLVGFGFGGSLAALFMRVGGGIYTKAADVGADLVGKVEAGIPEDDPRNPAVIADNVGDNVGDCAGMAADVFESYEVTLVAAIVLGAATAAIFPVEIWMKLILFAMMARGVGIITSIFGIAMVKGSDDLNSDPLKAIRRGFSSSAILAAILSFGLALFMLGGNIQTSELVSREAIFKDVLSVVQREGRAIAKKENKSMSELTSSDFADNKSIEDAMARLEIPEEQVGQAISSLVTADPAQIGAVPDFSGYRPVDFKDDSAPVLGLAMPNPALQSMSPLTPPPADAPAYVSVKEGLGTEELVVRRVKITQLDENGTAGQEQKQVVGPATAASIDQQLAMFSEQKFPNTDKPMNKVETEAEYPVTIYANSDGDIVAAVDPGKDNVSILSLQPSFQVFRETPETMLAIDQKRQENPQEGNFVQPATVRIDSALVQHQPVEWWRFALCITFGIGMAFVFEWLTDYYVSLHKKPVQELGDLAGAGPAPMIISGTAFGMESSVFSLVAIVLSLIAPLLIFPPAIFGGYILSFYGIALVGLGLLTTTGFILAMDTFGPISDNAQGVFEMSGAGEENPEGARRVQLLDAAGNTTKALTKGFAIATAVVAAVALFHAYVEEGKLTAVGMRLEIPEIFLGLLIGGAAPYLFSAFSINAVGRASFQLINEVRDQFRNDPGIMAGTSKPNYGKCVAIVTRAAQTELLGPGILAIAFPVIVAFGLAIGKPLTLIGGQEYNLVGAQALGGFLAGSILSGQLLAVYLANAGGMWDNSKKLIEDGLHGGKGTEAHKAAVVCDTVGDPFKDTAGPALNPLIKVMNLVALLLAPQVIRPWPQEVLITITVLAAIALGLAIWWSKRGGMGAGMAAAAEEATAKAEATSQVAEETN